MNGSFEGPQIGTKLQKADLVFMFRRYHDSIAQHKDLVMGDRLQKWADAEKERAHDRALLDQEFGAIRVRMSANFLSKERSALRLRTLGKNISEDVITEFKAKDAALEAVYEAEGWYQLSARSRNLGQRLDQDQRGESLDILNAVFPETDLPTWAPYSDAVAKFGGGILYDPDNVVEDAGSGLGFCKCLLKSAAVYLGAYELFQENKEGFLRAYPRALAFNPITNAIAWNKVQKQMSKAMTEAFPQRYKSKNHNLEALVVGILLFDQTASSVSSLDGVAYEAECEKLLSKAGYMVERTPATGDFGVDLLARKNGLTYAIQCKCYGTPVGVGAVQEVAAGMAHYVADCAVVVALSGFTKAARRLAESTSVLLLGLAQLSNVEDLALPLI